MTPSKVSPTSSAEQHRRGRFADLAFHLVGGIFLPRAVLGDRGELFDAVRRRRIRQRRFHEAARDEVRETSIGCGGVGVVGDGETEMPRVVRPGTLDLVLPGAHQLDQRQRQVGKAHGITRTLRRQEALQCRAVRFRRQGLAQLADDVANARPALGRAHDALE